MNLKESTMSEYFDVIASGCSFTDPKYYVDVDPPEDSYQINWSCWPEVLTKKYNKKHGTQYTCLNIAKAGQSNLKAIEDVKAYCYKALIKDKPLPKVILIGLTEWCRFSDVYQNFISMNHLESFKVRGWFKSHDLSDLNKYYSEGRFANEQVTKLYGFIPGQRYTFQCLRWHCEAVISLIEFTKKHNIKLGLFQILNPFSCPWPEGHQIKEFNDHINFLCDTHFELSYLYKYMDNLFDEKHVSTWGRPFVKITDKGNAHVCKSWREYEFIYHISSSDGHPNKEGQEFIAETVFKNFDSLLQAEV